MFNVGDRVVRLEDDQSYNALKKSTVYVVRKVGVYTDGRVYIVVDGFPDWYSFDSWKFELEEIYNSPLYQAMKEEENEQ